jgi:hypothetical protein
MSQARGGHRTGGERKRGCHAEPKRNVLPDGLDGWQPRTHGLSRAD